MSGIFDQSIAGSLFVSDSAASSIYYFDVFYDNENVLVASRGD
jgi:hypothetical protein